MSGELRKVTVLMAVYNGDRFLKYSVKSILNQTYKDFEFLIIDDGSTDNSERIINEFDDRRIRYEKISHSGLSSALNHGLRISSGDLVARIDSDDLCVPERLEKQLGFITANPDTDVLGSWSVYFKKNDKILFTIKPPVSDNDIKKFLLLHNPINHSSVIFRRKKMMESGGYNESFTGYEDFELWFRLSKKLTFAIMPEFLVFTRLHNQSMTKSESKKQIYGVIRENAIESLEKSDSEKERKFWNNILFWIEYFYGEKDKSRTYFAGDITIKKSIAYLSTFFPRNAFREIIEYRARQRIQTNFKGKSELKSQLEKLLK